MVLNRATHHRYVWKQRFSWIRVFTELQKTNNLLHSKFSGPLLLREFIWDRHCCWQSIFKRYIIFREIFHNNFIIKRLFLLEYVNTGTKFDNKQYHRKLKDDCNEDKVGDLILFFSKTITAYSDFTC